MLLVHRPSIQSVCVCDSRDCVCATGDGTYSPRPRVPRLYREPPAPRPYRRPRLYRRLRRRLAQARHGHRQHRATSGHRRAMSVSAHALTHARACAAAKGHRGGAGTSRECYRGSVGTGSSRECPTGARPHALRRPRGPTGMPGPFLSILALGPEHTHSHLALTPSG
jgi:hypothetical protein